MARPIPRRAGAGVLIAIAVAALALLVFTPNAVAASLGRLLADLWVATMGAVTGILGAMLGG